MNNCLKSEISVKLTYTFVFSPNKKNKYTRTPPPPPPTRHTHTHTWVLVACTVDPFKTLSRTVVGRDYIHTVTTGIVYIKVHQFCLLMKIKKPSGVLRLLHTYKRTKMIQRRVYRHGPSPTTNATTCLRTIPLIA